MKFKKFEEKDVQFLVKNYPLKGAAYCAKILNRKIRSVQSKAEKLGIKRIHGYANWNNEIFQKFEDVRLFYFLGIMWADGSIISYKSKKIHHHHISIEITSEDMADIEDVFNFIGNWSKRTRKRKALWKQTSVFTINSKPFYNLLKSLDFENKSKTSPSKILRKIPKKHHYIFWRGFFDGDGSLSYKENYYRCVKFSGSYEQDWSDLINVFKRLGVNFHYSTEISKKNHKSSQLSIQNKLGVKKILSYIYKDNLQLGFKRKRDKSLLLIPLC